jgi:hypothetical protein
MSLNPTSYNFKGDGRYNGLNLSTGKHYGLIAQEVERVLPDLVRNNLHTYEVAEEVSEGGPTTELQTTTQEMEYKSLNYTELIPFLIKAVQEQQHEIEKLKKELEKAKS